MREKKKVVNWMMVEYKKVGEDRMASKAVATFPEVFRASAGAASAGIRKAALQKASRWCKQRFSLMKQFQKMPLTISRVKRHVGHQRINRKVSCGRGRKRAAWVTALLDYLLSEFYRLRKAGLKLYTPF
jgi:alkylation response protein AidB-like acyl-CoA dehydrogenase